MGAQKVTMAFCFSDLSLITLNALASGVPFNPEYFIQNILPDILKTRRQIFHRFRRREFLCTWTIPCVTVVASSSMNLTVSNLTAFFAPLFARPESVRVFAIWNFEAENQNSGISSS
jgi:hypothetical protein